MSFTPPTIAEFKTQFAYDFPYATPVDGFGGDNTDSSKISDGEIQKAINLGKLNINQALFGEQDVYATAFCYLAAHYLVMNVRTSQQGLASAYNGNTIQKSAGSMQESFQITERIAKNAFFSYLMKTEYGATYLSTILPLLTGNVTLIRGDTTP